MSFAWVHDSVISDDRLTLRQMRVLLALLSFADRDTGECHPKRADLLKLTGYPETRLSAITTELVELGYLKKIGSGGRSAPVDYIVARFKPGTVEETVTDLVTDSRENGYRNGKETVTDLVTGNQQTNNRPTTDQVINPLPLCEQSAMPTVDTATGTPELGGRRARSSARTKGANNETGRNPVALPEWLPETEWQAYVDHRKAMRKPMTDEAQRRALKELGRLREQGNDPVRVIDASIANGWQGIFPLKDGGEAQKNPASAVRGQARGFDQQRGDFSEYAASKQRQRRVSAGIERLARGDFAGGPAFHGDGSALWGGVDGQNRHNDEGGNCIEGVGWRVE